MDHSVHFPDDPLEDVQCLDVRSNGAMESVFGDSMYSFHTESRSTFDEASKDLSLQRPKLPRSAYLVKKPIHNKPKKTKPLPKSNSDIAMKIGSPINHHKLEDLPPKADPYELVKLCRQGWTLAKGNAKRPVLGKIDPQIVEKDISKFSKRMTKAKEKKHKGASFSVGDKYDPSMWPSADTVSLVSGRSNGRKSRGFEIPGPKYVRHANPNVRCFSFPKDKRIPEERPRSPGPIYFPKVETVAPRHSSPRLDFSGRDIYGGIYWEQFSLKSAGNYYHGNEAYLNHSTAPAAIPSMSVTLPPKEENLSMKNRREQVMTNQNPITQLKRVRDKTIEGSIKKTA